MNWLQRRPWQRALAWLAGLAPFFYLSYGLANHLATLRAAVPSVVFEWEHQLPFWAWTIFPYWSINVFYGLSLFLCRNRHELDRHGLRLLTAQLVAVVCFVVFPLAFTFGQPPAEGPAGLLFDALRGFDKPFNQAPSLHIALAVILWDLYRRLLAAPWARLLLHVWTLAICLSVLTTYQHHFIDIPTGALLGLVCVWLWPLERRVAPARSWRLSTDPRRRQLALRYAAGSIVVLASVLALGGAALWGAWIAVALALVALNYLGFGAAGFGKQRDGRMAWSTRWMLAPYRLGAWLNSRWWTRHAPAPVEVVPGVWLGRLPGRSAGPWASSVDLTAECTTASTLPTLCIPLLDLAVPRMQALRRAAWAIERQRSRHGSVLVFCALGYSRSAAAIATWLLLTGRAPNAAAAVACIRRARPQVVLGAEHQLAVYGVR